jgi:hypothetical protein
MVPLFRVHKRTHVNKKTNASISAPWDEAYSVPLEKLNGALVLFGRRTGTERAQISPFSGSRIDFPRVQPVLTGLELANHKNLTREHS